MSEPRRKANDQGADVDERGVPVLSGPDAIPTRKGLASLSILTVLVAGIASVIPLAIAVMVFGWKDGWVVALSCIGSVAGSALADVIGRIKLRRRIMRLTRADDLAARLGTNTEHLTHLAEERGIKPQYCINGADYYDADDFGDAALLLRPAGAPEETLLHPAFSAPSHDEALLLHSIESTDDKG